MIDDDKALETYVPLGSPDTSSDITSIFITHLEYLSKNPEHAR